MDIDLHKKYFLMNFHGNKNTPHDFSLSSVHLEDNLYRAKGDQSKWKQKNLYDLGWGNEYGFVRLPELNSEELWFLLLHSDIQENKYGAANELQDKYPDELLVYVEKALALCDINYIEPNIREAVLMLKLNYPINRSSTISKSPNEVNEDKERWHDISKIVGVIKPDKSDKETQEEIQKIIKRMSKNPWWKFW